MLSPSSSAAAAGAGAAWLVLLEEGPAPASPACASALPVQANHLLPLQSTLHQPSSEPASVLSVDIETNP